MKWKNEWHKNDDEYDDDKFVFCMAKVSSDAAHFALIDLSSPKWNDRIGKVDTKTIIEEEPSAWIYPI